MANVITVKKPKVSVDPRNGSGVIRIDGEAIAILRDLAFQANMNIGEMAGNLIKYAAADTVIERED